MLISAFSRWACGLSLARVVDLLARAILDATGEPGTLLLAILYNRAPPESVSYSE
jgi:hypothetical protein